MADKTYGFKVTDDVYERAQSIIETSGLTAKEWFENALALYELKSMQTSTPEYTKDINELEMHTKRIYELVVNMIQQSVYLKDFAIKEITEKLDSREELIIELQAKQSELRETINRLTEENEQITENQSALRKQLDEQKNNIENSNLLISEYKEKNDTLSGLVTKFQGFAEENERLKELLAEEKNSASIRIKDLESNYHQATVQIRELETTLEQVKGNFERELEMIQERKNLEREKALVELERSYQTKLQEQHEKYNNKVATLQDENERIRKNYEYRLEKLLSSSSSNNDLEDNEK